MQGLERDDFGADAIQNLRVVTRGVPVVTAVKRKKLYEMLCVGVVQASRKCLLAAPSSIETAAGVSQTKAIRTKRRPQYAGTDPRVTRRWPAVRACSSNIWVSSRRRIETGPVSQQ